MIEDKKITMRRSNEEIEGWLADYLATLIGVNRDTVDADWEFDAYGVDSAAAIALMGDLEAWLDLELDPTLIYDHPTIRSLSGAIGRMA